MLFATLVLTSVAALAVPAHGQTRQALRVLQELQHERFFWSAAADPIETARKFEEHVERLEALLAEVQRLSARNHPEGLVVIGDAHNAVASAIERDQPTRYSTVGEGNQYVIRRHRCLALHYYDRAIRAVPRSPTRSRAVRERLRTLDASLAFDCQSILRYEGLQELSITEDDLGDDEPNGLRRACPPADHGGEGD